MNNLAPSFEEAFRMALTTKLQEFGSEQSKLLEKQFQERLRTELSSIVSSVVLSIFQLSSFERSGSSLLIRVEMPKND